MPQAQATKKWHQFNRGINSEQSEISMEDGFSTDEANYELLVDGSRKRRRGLQQEASGVNITIGSFSPTTNTSQSFVWRNAGGDTSTNFIVHKVGSILYFTSDADGGSASLRTETFDLNDYRVTSGNSNVAVPADFTQGRGVLFVTTQYNYPLWIKYDSANDTFTNGVIKIQIRDYQGIDDGVPLDRQIPSGLSGAATATNLATTFPDLRYNLLNRGWTDDNIVYYENNITGTARWPAKNQYWAEMFKRVANEGTPSAVEKDGTYTPDADKLDAHIFGGSDAPQGSLLLSIFNDTLGFKEVTVDGSGTEVEYDGGAASYGAGPPETLTATDVVVTDNGDDTYTFQITETGHSLSAGDEVRWIYGPNLVEITGATWVLVRFSVPEYVTVDASPGVNDWSFTVAGNGTDFSAITTIGTTYSGLSYQFKRYGYTPVARSSGTGPTSVGPKSVEFHGGRLWYAGMPDEEWADYIFYSQVVESERNYNRCHIENDPTSPNFNSPVPTDGGFLVIPNIGNVLKLLSYEDSLLVFTDQGVWEVRGQGTFFDPNNFIVRKITDVECGSAYSPIRVEGTVIFTGPKGVYAIAPNPYSRQLEAQSISDERIRTKWNAIGSTYEPYVKTAYDDAKKRLYVLQPGTANQLLSTNDGLVGNTPGISSFSVVWIYDLRVGAWYKYEFNQGTNSCIIGAFAITGQDSSGGSRKMKFLVKTASTILKICDLDTDNTSAGQGFQDWDGNTVRAKVFTAYDNIGTMTLRKQAPIVTVFSKRTETGYVSSGGGWAPINPSSTEMTAYWDWTDDSVTGKVGSTNEVYRHTRAFVPSGANDEDGYPVVVTRNKVRGRGRVLQLLFQSSTDASGEDSHILGFTIDYKVSGRK